MFLDGVRISVQSLSCCQVEVKGYAFKDIIFWPEFEFQFDNTMIDNALPAPANIEEKMGFLRHLQWSNYFPVAVAHRYQLTFANG